MKPLPRHDGPTTRAALTCAHKCGNACAQTPPNTSEGNYFRELAAIAMSRRDLLRGGSIAVLTAGAAPLLNACGTDGDNAHPATTMSGPDFSPVAPNTADHVVIPEGYAQAVVIRWGDPLFPDAPPFDFARQTPQAQNKQFGFNNDFAGLLPVPGQPHAYLLVVNHEYTTESAMFTGYDPSNPTPSQVAISMAAHGITVVEVHGGSGTGRLTPVFGKYNRRITASTEFRFTGPAAGSGLLTTAADPGGTAGTGTLANCSGGLTPWGTLLSGEENFNAYFASPEKVRDPIAAARLRRYGFVNGKTTHLWERFEKRFDLAQEPNEANRFGWIVEVNPWDPASVPVKHTALGRFKHEAATVYVTGNGTVVAYSGDDEKFEYLYKFVSKRKVQPGTGAASMRHNLTILDAGTLYVARLSGTPAQEGGHGSGEWIPLLETGEDGGAKSWVDGMSPAEVSVFTRLAGDRAGATKMDRPEDFEANPKTGKVYVALTNNDRRGAPGAAPADAANPRVNNKNGQVLEITDDHAGTRFSWSLLLVCGDPHAADTYYGGFSKSQVSAISCPDNLAFDPYGNLWISTDGNALKSNDGLFCVALDGPRRGETRQFLTVPKGAETCGPVITEDRVLVCVQHPGELDGTSADNPASHWPDGGNSQPRPAVVAVWRSAHVRR